MIRSLDIMANRVCRMINVSNALTYKTAKVYEWLNARMRDIYESQWWPKTINFYTVAVPVNTSEVTLPKQIGSVLRIVNITTGESVYLIDPAAYSDKTISLRNVFRIFLESELMDETPVGTALGTSNVLAQPANASVIKISSSAAGDITGSVYVRGVGVSGEIVQDTINLNGLTVVAGVAVFASVESVSKTVNTTGVITVTDAVPVTLATITGYEVSPEYQRIKLETTTSSPGSLSVCAQRAFVPFLNGADVPVFEMEDALVRGATADAWREQGAFDKAQVEEGLFESECKKLVNRWFEKSGNATLMLPRGRA